jgi:hypothetical protein
MVLERNGDRFVAGAAGATIAGSGRRAHGIRHRSLSHVPSAHDSFLPRLPNTYHPFVGELHRDRESCRFGGSVEFSVADQGC